MDSLLAIPAALFLLAGIVAAIIIWGKGAPKREELRRRRNRVYLSGGLPDLLASLSEFQHEMTDIQKGKLWNEKYRGKWVKWDVEIKNVDSARLTFVSVGSWSNEMKFPAAYFSPAELLAFKKGIPGVVTGELGTAYTNSYASITRQTIELVSINGRALATPLLAEW